MVPNAGDCHRMSLVLLNKPKAIYVPNLFVRFVGAFAFLMRSRCRWERSGLVEFFYPVFLHLAVESTTGDIQLLSSLFQVPVCFIQDLMYYSCFRKRE